MSHNIIVESGKAFRLLTSGKYCDQDIIITAEGGKEDLDAVLTEQDELIDELREVLKSKGSGGGGGELNMGNCEVTFLRPNGNSIYYGRELAYTDGTVHYLFDTAMSGNESKVSARCESIMYIIAINRGNKATCVGGEVLETGLNGLAIKMPATAGATVTITFA